MCYLTFQTITNVQVYHKNSQNSLIRKKFNGSIFISPLWWWENGEDLPSPKQGAMVKLYLEALNLILHSISMVNSLKLKTISDQYLPLSSCRIHKTYYHLLECLHISSRANRKILQQFQKQFCNFPTWPRKNSEVRDVCLMCAGITTKQETRKKKWVFSSNLNCRISVVHSRVGYSKHLRIL